MTDNTFTEAEIPFPSNGLTGKTYIVFREDMFCGDSAVYDHSLCRFAAQFMSLSYKMPPDDPRAEKEYSGGLYCALKTFGFSDIESEPLSARDEENYFIASRRISVLGKEYDLIFTSYIGSLGEQWYTNFDSGTSPVHKGFAAARDFVLEKLRAYAERIGAKKETTKILMIGHSRGAATANLAAAKLIKEEILVKKENLYTYTFATPSPTNLPERREAVYRRIFNIVNDEDFVTRCMPKAWGYGRYGITFVLPNKDNTENFDAVLENMNRYYTALVPEDRYLPFKNGTAAVDAVCNSLVSYAKNIYEFYFRKFRCPGAKKMSIHDYFDKTLCAITGEMPGSKKNKEGTLYMMATALDRVGAAAPIRAIADFFVFYEGLGGATGKKVSSTYFSYAHSMDTYCAFLLSQDEDSLIPEEP